MQVFLSYRRADGGWTARAVRQALEQYSIDVFMDVEDIDSGRFENIILNQIGMREHFVVLFTPSAARELGGERDWVTRELERAMDLGKNVVPVLVDDAQISDIADAFTRRDELLELNFMRMPHDFFEQAVTVLVERFLTQPNLQELRTRTAEEHYDAGTEALDTEDWERAEAEYDQAVALRTRPEYLLGRGVARHHMGRDSEALNDLDAAVALDPFAFELMNAKFDLLQGMDRMRDAIQLQQDWQLNAEGHASTLGQKIIDRLDRGDDVVSAVRDVPELGALYGHLSLYEEVGASLSSIVEHAPSDIQIRLQAELGNWRASMMNET